MFLIRLLFSLFTCGFDRVEILFRLPEPLLIFIEDMNKKDRIWETLMEMTAKLLM